MHSIEILYGGAMEEITSAKEYAEHAARYKEKDPELSKFFIGLANTELEHAKGFMSHVDRKVADIPERDWRFDELIGMFKTALTRQMAEAKAAVELAK